jgi:hypothetical protein
MWETATFCWKLRIGSYIYKSLDTATLILYMTVAKSIYRLMYR